MPKWWRERLVTRQVTTKFIVMMIVTMIATNLLFAFAVFFGTLHSSQKNYSIPFPGSSGMFFFKSQTRTWGEPCHQDLSRNQLQQLEPRSFRTLQPLGGPFNVHFVEPPAIFCCDRLHSPNISGKKVITFFGLCWRFVGCARSLRKSYSFNKKHEEFCTKSVN